MVLSPLRLKKHEDRRLKSGHLWIYSNEVDVVKTPLTSFAPGQLIVVETHEGKAIGMGYINPNSLLCARLLSRNPNQRLDKNFIVERLKTALALREAIFHRPFYRLVFGESDFLPGVIIDRYDNIYVVQITTAGMEQVKQLLLEAINEVLQPQGVLLRNDSSIRAMEGLTAYVEPVLGIVPDKILLEENGVSFQTSLTEGQKTGWFYDHRLNRLRLKDYVAGKRVLDVFSYIGGWGIQAAIFGASHVTCLDASEKALLQAQVNAKLNKVAEKLAILQGDAFSELQRLQKAGEKFDVVILDPPAFIKKRKDIKEGVNAYRRINESAMQLVADNGILVSASCSLHLPSAKLVEILGAASQRLGRHIQILEQGHQGPDHPVHPHILETNYLKAFFTRLY